MHHEQEHSRRVNETLRKTGPSVLLIFKGKRKTGLRLHKDRDAEKSTIEVYDSEVCM